MEKIKVKRTEWDLSHVIASENPGMIANLKAEIQKKHDEFVKKWRENKDYLTRPEVLRKALDEYNGIKSEYLEGGRYLYYYYLRKSLDQNDHEIKAKLNKATEFGKKLENEISFFLLNVSRIKEQSKFLESKELKEYGHFLEKLFRESKHLLSEEAEKILNLKSKSSYSDWVSMTSNFLAKEEREVIDESGKKKKVSFSEIVAMTNSKDKKVRDLAAKTFNEILEKHSDVAEAELNAILGNKKVDDDLRKMLRPDYARILDDDINEEIVDVLIKSVSSRFDISKRFYKLLASLMKVKKLEYHERNVPYGKLDKKYSYEEAIQLVHRVLGNLDKEFAELLKNFVDEGRIDVYSRRGKSSGAFCVYWGVKLPVYVLLNYNEKIEDILTIAHELGHGINDELMRKKQNAINFGTPMATAEVASTFMEDFVLEELMKEADDELKLAILVKRLMDDISTINRQIACYMFEQELHKEYREKGHLSKKDIGKLFQKHMHAYMGDYIEKSQGSENWWIYWGHIRRFFYNYSYASGLIISKSLQGKVRKDKKNVAKVKEFLETGLSKSPRDIFLKLGIDIKNKEFWDAGLDEIDKNLMDAEKLAKKLRKI